MLSVTTSEVKQSLGLRGDCFVAKNAPRNDNYTKMGHCQTTQAKKTSFHRPSSLIYNPIIEYVITMTQFSFTPSINWTVSELTQYLRGLFATADELQDLWVTGEVSNATRSSAGHFYFTLKDNTASIRCVMWRQQFTSQHYLPKDGELLQVHGYIDIYPPNGVYQLYADRFSPLGAGLLFQEFIRLKNKLEKEGLFNPENKRSIPTHPKRIGIVTSLAAAALQDILNTLRRRYPLAEVIVAPALVQGEDAPASLIRALLVLDQQIKPDVIILARGGGSIEDLWAFNDEQLVRVIASLETPIVTGIGHETDFTLADFASDLRAPTPTAAAELITPNINDLRASLVTQLQRLLQATQLQLYQMKQTYQTTHHRFELISPLNRIQIFRQRLDEIHHLLIINTQHTIGQKENDLQSLAGRLSALNPQNILEHGFAILQSSEGELIHSINQVHLGETIGITLADGNFDASVENIYQ